MPPNVVLDTVPQPAFLKHVEKVGSYFKAQLLGLQQKYPALIKEVRGTGLILGAELTRPGRDIVNDVLAKGAIINCTAGNVLRFIPPLIITEQQVDDVLAKLDDVLPKYC